MKKLLIYLKENTKECILAPLFKLLEAIFELFVPLIVASIIDNGIAAGDKYLIIKDGLLLLLLAVVGLVSAITAQFFAARAATGFSARLKSALIRHIYALSPRQADQISIPTLITRMTGDVNQVQSGVNMALRLLLRSPFIVFGAMIMAFTVDVPAACVLAVIIPILGCFVAFILAKTLPKYKDIRKKSDKVLGVTRENLTGVRVIRAFGREDDEEARMQDAHDKLTDMQMKTHRIASLLNPVTLILIDAALAVLIYIGAIRVNIGILSQGQVVALTNYISQILVELIKLANLLVTLTNALACASRISDVMSIAPDMANGTDAPDLSGENAVRFDHVSLSYNGSEDALKDISFTIKKGSSFGIIGGTGSGKSSVVSLLMRLYDATKGQVMIGNGNIKTLDWHLLRNKIACVPQKAQLFRGTIRENLLVGNRNADDQALWDVLDAAQARDFVESLDAKLDAPVEQNGNNFSGGQKQRLTIARALVRKPDILILDDSASALDAQTDANLQHALSARFPDTTLIVVSQRASSVMKLDSILMLEDGTEAGLGTHEELLSTCPAYLETYEAQFPKEVSL